MKNMDVYLVIVFLVVIAGLGYLLISQNDTLKDNKKEQTEIPTPQEQTDEASKSAILSESTDSALTLQDKLNFRRPEMSIDQNKKYTAILKTSEGDITIELFADKTPVTVNNFVSLSKAGFYDGVIFHRVIKEFMIQTGDPVGNGTGGPAYIFDNEPFDGEYTTGTVAMANAGPNTNGSQFFIMHKDNELPLDYVIFGKVTEGMDIVDKIATAEVQPSAAGERSSPVNPAKIVSINIEEK